MTNNPNQPREFDAVLGGETLTPVQGAVLGGIEGVKRRLSSSNIVVASATTMIGVVFDISLRIH